MEARVLCTVSKQAAHLGGTEAIRAGCKEADYIDDDLERGSIVALFQSDLQMPTIYQTLILKLMVILKISGAFPNAMLFHLGPMLNPELAQHDSTISTRGTQI